MFAVDRQVRFHKTLETDSLWVASQEPCVMRLYLTCISSDCFGSRFEWLKPHKLSINSFKKAKKVLEKAKLFEFKPEYGILPSGKHGVIGWLVRNVLNRKNIETSDTTDTTSQNQVLTFKPRASSAIDLVSTEVDSQQSSIDDDDQLLTINHEKTLINQASQNPLDLNLDKSRLTNQQVKEIKEITSPSEDISINQDPSKRTCAYMFKDSSDAKDSKIGFPCQNELQDTYELEYEQTSIEISQEPVEGKIESNGEPFSYDYHLADETGIDLEPKIEVYTDEEAENDRRVLNALIESRLASRGSNFDGQISPESRESKFDSHDLIQNDSFVNSEDETHWFRDVDPSTVPITDNFDWSIYPINYFPDNDSFKDAATEYQRVVDFAEVIDTDQSNPYFIRAIEYLRNRMRKVYIEEMSISYPDFWDTPIYFDLKGWSTRINDLGIKFIFGKHMLTFLEPDQSDITNLTKAFGRDKLICQFLLDDESNTEALEMLKEMYAEIWTDMRKIDECRHADNADIDDSEDW